MSIPLEGQAAPMEKRDHRRSTGACLGSHAGPSENIRRTVTFFVERYHERPGVFPSVLDRFGKAVLF